MPCEAFGLILYNEMWSEQHFALFRIGFFEYSEEDFLTEQQDFLGADNEYDVKPLILQKCSYIANPVLAKSTWKAMRRQNMRVKVLFIICKDTNLKTQLCKILFHYI
jgi:hypothetical protein